MVWMGLPLTAGVLLAVAGLLAAGQVLRVVARRRRRAPPFRIEAWRHGLDALGAAAGNGQRPGPRPYQDPPAAHVRLVTVAPSPHPSPDGQPATGQERPGNHSRSTPRRDPSGHPVTVPARTTGQRRAALAQAAGARRARAELLAALTAGQQTLPAVLQRATSDKVVRRTRVVQLLKALPGVGDAKAAALMGAARIAASRRAGGLSERQRRALPAALTASQARPPRKAPVSGTESAGRPGDHQRHG